MNVNAQKFQSLYELVCKSLAWRNHRTTLPQLRCAQQLPQGGSRDGLCHSSNRPEAATLRAIFIAPTKLRNFYISPFNVPPGNREGAGDFHRPYENSEDLRFTV